MNQKRMRIATYLEEDIITWLKAEAAKLRTNESALIRQILAEKMEQINPIGD
jgi:hypothetical protein